MQDFTERDKQILATLYPPFSEMVEHFMKYCWREGLPVHLSQGFRLFGEQDALYRQGKSQAKGGESLHCYGLAFDIVFDGDETKTGIQNPYIEPIPGAWEKCANIASRCGLWPGYYWKTFQDKPHFEAKIQSKKEDLRRVFIKEATKGLYAYLDNMEKEAFVLPPSAYV